MSTQVDHGTQIFGQNLNLDVAVGVFLDEFNILKSGLWVKKMTFHSASGGVSLI